MGRCTVSTVSTLWCSFICLNTHFPHWQTCCRMGRCTVSTVSTLWCLFICLNTHFPHWQTCYRMRRCTDPRCPSWPRAPRIPSQRQEAGSKIHSSPPCGWALKMDGEQIPPPPPSSPLPDVWVCVCVSGSPPPPPRNHQVPCPCLLLTLCVLPLSLSLFSNFLSTTTLSFLSLSLPLLSAPSTPPNPPPHPPDSPFCCCCLAWFDVLLVLENENTWQVMRTHGKLFCIIVYNWFPLSCQ